jgi:small subunit ribosomal protein S1
MVEEPITVSVIEVDRERRRLILSERAALQETRESLKERLLEELSEGDVRTGRVTSLADFGAFVNIDGADGLVHLSEISWDRIEHPREVLSVGQEVEVKVIGVDRERKRIGLSIRQLQEDPWVQKVEALKEGQLIEGTITHLTKFGAFARLDDDLEGLIHISEISDQRVEHPKEVLHEGDVVTLRVIKIEPERHRIGLSLRKVDSPAYTDFDWKMTLAEVVEETHGEEGEDSAAELPADEEPAEAPEVDAMQDSVEAYAETEEAEKEEEAEPAAEEEETPEAEADPGTEDFEAESDLEEEAAPEMVEEEQETDEAGQAVDAAEASIEEEAVEEAPVEETENSEAAVEESAAEPEEEAGEEGEEDSGEQEEEPDESESEE